jgi:adenine phosphoribosyltransferase
VDLKDYIRDIPDFPKPGVVFKDITPLLRDAAAYREAVRQLASLYGRERIDTVVGIDARGFIFGAAVAYERGVGFVPVRKRGKLPWQTKQQTYELEYGSDALEVHVDALRPGERVLIVDDVLATGGSLRAALDLLRELGGEVVGIALLIELSFLKGRERLPDSAVKALITY